MKCLFAGWALVVCLFCSSACFAQNTGRVECPRNDGYVYLYSSMTSLEVRATMQCGEVVQITGRYDNYFAVRTTKGDVGFVPLVALVLLKDQTGPGLPNPAPVPAHERTHYDETPAKAPIPAAKAAVTFTLLNNTPVRLKLAKTISSATAHVGDTVEFEVLYDVYVEGEAVLPKGSRATGQIVEAEAKKRFGHDGRLAFNINSVRMASGEQAALRFNYDISSSASAHTGVPLGSGKDVTIPQDMEFTALVDGDVPLKHEAFSNSGNAVAPAPEPSAQGSQPQR